MKLPTISVVMPVYNAGEYLSLAIDSLVGQTFTDFEVIAINDGSSDESGEILDKIAETDSRFRIIHQKNKGLVATLNYGVSLAKASIIARMDADDISLDNRFETEFPLFSDKNVVLVVGGYEELGTKKSTVHTPPSQQESLSRSLYVQNYIGHGTVMFRKDSFVEVGGYRQSVGPVEDYDLWIRLSELGKISSVKEVVYLWRVTAGGITSTQNVYQEDCAKKLRDILWHTLPQPLTKMDLKNNKWTKIDLEIEARLFVHYLRRHHFRDAYTQFIALLSSRHSGAALAIQAKRIIRGWLS